jgi:hypothetical protein
VSLKHSKNTEVTQEICSVVEGIRTSDRAITSPLNLLLVRAARACT